MVELTVSYPAWEFETTNYTSIILYLCTFPAPMKKHCMFLDSVTNDLNMSMS